MNYSKDRKWSDQFLPCMRQLIGPHLLVPSPLEVDIDQASDLVVLRGRDMMIACRVRRPGFADRYPWDITIRAKRDSGSRTELVKLREGWGDWMFYGHSAADEKSFSRWFLVDLHVWRGEFIRDGFAVALGKQPQYGGVFKRQSNYGDGTHFVAFDVRRFPGRLIIASSHPIEPNPIAVAVA